jgi:hypothetical protein
VEELHHGSTILLSYFHYCNKGGHPFSLDWANSLNGHLAQLSSEHIKFLRETAELVKDKGKFYSKSRKGEDPRSRGNGINHCNSGAL